MAIEFNCDNCQKLLRTSDDKAGLGAKCPFCGEAIIVPDFGEDESESTFYPRDEETGFGEELDSAGSGNAAASPFAGAEATKTCPMCGEQIKAAAIRCRHCGEDLQAPGSHSSYVAPHRGGMILAFGILSWVLCIFFGIAAWIMGNEDLKAMEAGQMDPAGEGLTRAGKILGMVHVILAVCVLFFSCAFIVIAVTAGGL